MTIQRREIKTIKGFLQVTGSLVGTERVQTIDARTLWKWLEVKTKFADWIKQRIQDGQFEDNKDFVTVSEKKVVEEISNLQTTLIEYRITLDMAKHIAMLERTTKREASAGLFYSM